MLCHVTTVQAGGGGVMVWGIFSWHTLGPLVPIGHCLNDTTYLSIVSGHVHPFMATMSQSLNHFKLVFWTWQWVPCTKMASTVTRSQPNRASLGCGETGASCPGCASHKSPSTARCYPINILSAPCWINATEWRQFWRRKWVKHSISKVFLIIL